MALAIVTATGFDEALVQREIVSDAVSPVLVLFKEYVNYDSSESQRWYFDLIMNMSSQSWSTISCKSDQNFDVVTLKFALNQNFWFYR